MTSPERRHNPRRVSDTIQAEVYQQTQSALQASSKMMQDIKDELKAIREAQTTAANERAEHNRIDKAWKEKMEKMIDPVVEFYNDTSIWAKWTKRIGLAIVGILTAIAGVLLAGGTISSFFRKLF